MALIASYELPRRRALLLGCAVGVALGFINWGLGLDFLAGGEPTAAAWLGLLGEVLLAVALTVSLHEGIHGLAAVLCGRRPRFGLKPPLVYVTFREKIPRGRFILIALAPLLVLDGLAVLGWFFTPWPLFAYTVGMFNTIGAVGDLWITAKLLPQARGTLVQDTMTGVEVWAAEEG